MSSKNIPSLEKVNSILFYYPEGEPSNRGECFLLRGGRTDSEILNQSEALPGTEKVNSRYNEFLEVEIDGIFYRACDLAWFMYTKKWPKNIGFINNKADNRISNLYEIIEEKENAS